MKVFRRIIALACFAFGGFYFLGLFDGQFGAALAGFWLLLVGWGLWHGEDPLSLWGSYTLCAVIGVLGRNQRDSAVVLALFVTAIYALVRYRRRRRRQVAWFVDQGITDRSVQKSNLQFQRDMDHLEQRYKSIIDEEAKKIAKLKG